MLRLIVLSGFVVVGLVGCSGGGSPPDTGPTAKAVCGPGSNPETGIQGRVSRAEHRSGRAAEGYTCNTELVGSYADPQPIGTIGGYKVQRYVDELGNECAYFDSALVVGTGILDGNIGVKVLDMNDPSNAVLTSELTSLAMISPHESMVISKERGLLAAVMGTPALAPGIVDVYDLKPDCRQPELKASSWVGVFGHESGISPDGKTLYSASPGTPTLTAVDISDPSNPRRLWTGPYTSHGVTVSDDGNRLYAAFGNLRGVMILDVSEIQARKSNPRVPRISTLSWPNSSIPQIAEPFSRDGVPYLFEVDEYSFELGIIAVNGTNVGAARIIDISDETQPKVVSDIKLEVHEPENRDILAGDPGALLPFQGYAGHYCNVEKRVNPKIAACSMIMSGLRIFDISDPKNPKEIAYFNAPTRPRITPILESSSFAMSQPAIIPERKEIWYTDGYNGFYAIRVTNGVW